MQSLYLPDDLLRKPPRTPKVRDLVGPQKKTAKTAIKSLWRNYIIWLYEDQEDDRIILEPPPRRYQVAMRMPVLEGDASFWDIKPGIRWRDYHKDTGAA